jgi:two-component system, cell cycle sensor histidine kinase and response regulator CckA
MAQSGAVQSIQESTSFRGWVSQRPDWRAVGASVRGPLLTLAAAILLDILARERVAVVYPFPVLILTVIYAAASGGLRSGVVSAVLTVLYAVHFFSEPRSSLHYTRNGAYSLILVGVATPVVAIVVARLRSAASAAHGLEFTRAEIEAMDRRLSFYAAANLALASTLDLYTVLRDLARMMAPSICDWCAIHVASEQGRLEYVSGAHRDPARDLVVRALCEYGSRSLPFGRLGTTPELREVTDELLRTEAKDQEHLKLYRALSPTSLIRVPLMARGGVAGVLTLATMSDSGRRFGLADLEFAEELAGRVGLTVDHGRIHREAREADRRYRLLFDANPQPMWVFDVETLAFLAVNDAAVRHYGYSREEFLSMTIMDIRPPDDTPGLLPGGERGSPRGEVAVTQHQRKDGSIIEVEIVSHELEMDGRRARLVLATDTSERTRVRAALHQSEEQLRHAQRMDAVGRLASGVAHDFNNLLTTIRGFSDLLIHDLPPGDQRRSDAEQIRKAADRGAHLSRQLLSFGRKQVAHPRPVNLNGVVSGMQELIQRLVGADVQLETSLEPGLGPVRMDAGQLEQVLVNLVLNAREAMPGGGTLTIKTGEREVASAGRSRHLPPGRYGVLAVGDTGSGVDLEGLNPVFQPFHAGPHRQRAGLGLSIVYGIVRQNGGAVRVSSEPEQGTVVKVYLPRVEEETSADWELPASLHGNETILVAEDEMGVRDLIHKILVEQGHTVLVARNGREALEMARGYEGPIHLVLSDVVMPEMGGSEFVRALVELRPSVRVLFVSGYTTDEVLHRGIGQNATFVSKPFAPDELVRKVRETLDAQSA